MITFVYYTMYKIVRQSNGEFFLMSLHAWMKLILLLSIWIWFCLPFGDGIQVLFMYEFTIPVFVSPSIYVFISCVSTFVSNAFLVKYMVIFGSRLYPFNEFDNIFFFRSAFSLSWNQLILHIRLFAAIDIEWLHCRKNDQSSLLIRNGGAAISKCSPFTSSDANADAHPLTRSHVFTIRFGFGVSYVVQYMHQYVCMYDCVICDRFDTVTSFRYSLCDVIWTMLCHIVKEMTNKERCGIDLMNIWPHNYVICHWRNFQCSSWDRSWCLQMCRTQFQFYEYEIIRMYSGNTLSLR